MSLFSNRSFSIGFTEQFVDRIEFLVHRFLPAAVIRLTFHQTEHQPSIKQRETSKNLFQCRFLLRRCTKHVVQQIEIVRHLVAAIFNKLKLHKQHDHVVTFTHNQTRNRNKSTQVTPIRNDTISSLNNRLKRSEHIRTQRRRRSDRDRLDSRSPTGKQTKVKFNHELISIQCQSNINRRALRPLLRARGRRA